MMMNAKKSSNVNITRYLFLIPAVMVLLLIFSVSKAELNRAVKSSAHMLAGIKKAVIKINMIPGHITAITHKKTEIFNSVNVFKTDPDTIVKRKSKNTLSLNYSFTYDSAGKKGNNGFQIVTVNDTNKKPVIKLKGTTGPKSDIYINGVKTDAGLENLSPNNVESINVVKDTIGKKNGSIFIITKGVNSSIINHLEANLDTIINGKRIKANRNALTAVVVAGKPFTRVKINGKIFDATGQKTGKTIINGDTVYTTSDLTALRSKSRNIDSLITRINGIAVGPNGTITRVITDYNTNPARILNVRATAAPISFTNKLIIIDGKEATQKQMKKLSADKIETISRLSGEAATALYGDKAKNGVVVITTKK